MAATARELIDLHRHAASARDPQPIAGDGLLHPLVLAALVVLVVNDHLLKPMLPGIVGGKLSDLAGLLLAPIVIVAAIELATAAAGRRFSPGRGQLIVIFALAATAFGLAKVTPAGALILGTGIGVGQWIGGLALSPMLGPPPPPAMALVVVDPTDLVALSSVALALAISLRRRAWLTESGWR
jgi:hypothetical protein